MIIKYEGKRNGVSTIFTIKIIGNNLSKTSSNYQIFFMVGNQPLPLFKTLIHKRLSNCLKEVYLFRKFNGIELDAATEKVGSKVTLYDAMLYNYHKPMLFLV